MTANCQALRRLTKPLLCLWGSSELARDLSAFVMHIHVPVKYSLLSIAIARRTPLLIQPIDVAIRAGQCTEALRVAVADPENGIFFCDSHHGAFGSAPNHEVTMFREDLDRCR